MKQFILFLSCVFALSAQAQKANPNYDSTLAKRLGADNYGMKKYVFVILKTGSATMDNKAKKDSIFAGHLENIGRLAKLGKMVVAGPLGKNDKTYRGIFILNAATFEEAHALLDSDPAVKAKLLEPELYEWYGSAALPEYLKAHEKAGKYKIE